MTLVPFEMALAAAGGDLDEYGLLPPAWDRLQDQLIWQYGYDRMFQIMDGSDARFNADLQSWRQFGRPKP